MFKTDCAAIFCLDHTVSVFQIRLAMFGITPYRPRKVRFESDLEKVEGIIFSNISRTFFNEYPYSLDTLIAIKFHMKWNCWTSPVVKLSRSGNKLFTMQDYAYNHNITFFDARKDLLMQRWLYISAIKLDSSILRTLYYMGIKIRKHQSCTDEQKQVYSSPKWLETLQSSFLSRIEV